MQCGPILKRLIWLEQEEEKDEFLLNESKEEEQGRNFVQNNNEFRIHDYKKNITFVNPFRRVFFFLFLTNLFRRLMI